MGGAGGVMLLEVVCERACVGGVEKRVIDVRILKLRASQGGEGVLKYTGHKVRLVST